MAAIPLPCNRCVNAGIKHGDLKIQGVEHGDVALRRTAKDSDPSGILCAVRANIVQRIIELHQIVAVFIPGLKTLNVGTIRRI